MAEKASIRYGAQCLLWFQNVASRTCFVGLHSGVSRAWHGPWAPLWRGPKNCLAKM